MCVTSILLAQREKTPSRLMIGHRDLCFIAPPQFWGYSFPEWILCQGGVDCELRSELTNKLYILPFVICSETPGVPISLSPSPKQYSSTSDGHGKQNTSCLSRLRELWPSLHQALLATQKGWAL